MSFGLFLTLFVGPILLLWVQVRRIWYVALLLIGILLAVGALGADGTSPVSPDGAIEAARIAVGPLLGFLLWVGALRRAVGILARSELTSLRSEQVAHVRGVARWLERLDQRHIERRPE